MRKRTLAALGVTVLLAPAVQAGELPLPSGDVVLTVTGAIDNTNIKGQALFDMGMLDALPSRTTTTNTPWYDSKVSFKGPLGADLLKSVGAHGTMVRVTAIDDYASEIPLQDFLDSPVIFATSLNGQPMSVRDKGPIFVVYPFDIRPDLYNEAYFGKSVWQVKAIEIH
jgi:hypothetical protein